MIYINPTLTEINKAKDIHLKKINCFLRKKLNQPVCSNTCEICNSQIEIVLLDIRLQYFLLQNDNLEKIIIGNPKELFDLNIEFWKILKNDFNINDWKNYIENNVDGIRDVKNQLQKIFKYKDWFCDKKNKYYNAYDLAKNLDRNSCTYCNRIYTSTIITRKGKKIIRPTLDHWYPKTDFPLLSLSFFNLIPSCSNCNSSIKGATNFNLSDHIHPYVDTTQNDDFKFNYRYNKKLKEYRIYIQDTNYLNSKTRTTLQSMFIDEMYNSHQSELEDLIKIKINYSDSYIENIEKLFGAKLSREEVYRILFGVEYDSKKFHKLPLSKFKNDILKELGII